MDTRLRQKAVSLVALALALAAVATAPARAADVPPGFFGLGGWSYPDDAQAVQLGDAGLRLFRAGLPWDLVEPAPGLRDWSQPDHLAVQARRDGFDILFVLSGCAAWACGSVDAAPKDEPVLSQYRGFVADAVRRYGSGGTFWGGGPGPHVTWQVGNEVNGGRFFGPSPRPADYASFLAAISATIKDADPSATVVASGLVENPADHTGMPLGDFLRGLYQQPGFTSSADAVAVHAYAEDPAGSIRVLDEARDVMLEYHDTRPVWITEMGWATGAALDEATQAAYLRSAWDTMLACRSRWNLQRVMWFAAADADGSADGLLRQDGSPKPAYDAFRDYLAPRLPAGRADSCSLPGGPALDRSDPDTAIVQAPSLTNDPVGQTVSFVSSEPTARFECAMDGAEAMHPCASPYDVSSSREGEHFLLVRSVDAQGNADPSPARTDWRVDLSPPDTTLVSRTPRVSRATVMRIAFMGRDADGIAGFQCRLDARGWLPCTSPYRSPRVRPGLHAVAIRAIDRAGNVDASPVRPTFRLTRDKRVK